MFSATENKKLMLNCLNVNNYANMTGVSRSYSKHRQQGLLPSHHSSQIGKKKEEDKN